MRTSLRRGAVRALSLLALLLGLAPASQAFTLIGVNFTLQKASGADTIAANGASGVGVANGPRYSVSDDGCWVVFTSTATNLTAATDTNGQSDVFLYLACGASAGTITLVSHTSGLPNQAATGASDQPVISSDGLLVAFRSTAADIVPGGGYGVQTNVFLWTRGSDTFQLVSHNTGGANQAGNGNSQNGVISRTNGTSFVAFESVATNLVGGDTNGVSDIFRFDASVAPPNIVRVSVTNLGANANNGSFNPVIDGAGDCIAFESLATNLIVGLTDTNAARDIFRWKQGAAPPTLLLSHVTAVPTQTGNGASTLPSIDDGCSTFAFRSAATNLVFAESDANGGPDVYWATNSGDAALASHNAGTASQAGNGASDAPILNRNGTFVAYASVAKDLVSATGGPAPGSNVFLYNIAGDSNTLVSHTAANAAIPANGQSFAPEINTSGLYVAYESDATDIDPNQNDSNGMRDVYLYNARWNNAVVASHRYASIAITGNGVSRGAALSGAGYGVAFTSGSDNLIADDPEGSGLIDVFIWGSNPLMPFMSARSTNTANTIEWITPPVNYVSMQMRVSATTPCSSLQFSDVSWVALGAGSPPANNSSLFTDPTAYPAGTDRCYGIFLQRDSAAIQPTDTPARTITAHTVDDTTGPVKWASNIAGVAALSQVGLGTNLVAVANDGGVYGLKPGPTGGFWSSGYWPFRTDASAIQSRPPVVVLSVLGSTYTTFVGSQDGRVYAFDADRGGRAGGALWYTSPLLGNMVQSGLAGIFTRFGGVGDHLLVGSRNSPGASQFFALDPTTGKQRPGSPFSGGGFSIGAINTSASVDYSLGQVYFASLEFAAGQPSLWCLKLTASGLGGPCWTQTSPVGISGGPVQRNGMVYAGDDSGQVWAFNATDGTLVWGPFTSPCGGINPIKSFVLADRQGTAQDLYYATSSGLCAITDTGAVTPPLKWSIGTSPAPAGIPGPSAPLLIRVGGVAYIYVGSSDGHLYQVRADDPTPTATMKSVLIRTGATIGPPAFDVGDNMIYVGSDAGAFYAVQAPLP